MAIDYQFRAVYREPLSVVRFSSAEQSIQRVVPWKNKSRKVGKKLTSDVEEDEKEVECNDTQESVDLGNVALLLEVVQGWVLGELRPQLVKKFIHQRTSSTSVVARTDSLSIPQPGVCGNLLPYQFGRWFPELCLGTTFWKICATKGF